MLMSGVKVFGEGHQLSCEQRAFFFCLVVCLLPSVGKEIIVTFSVASLLLIFHFLLYARVSCVCADFTCDSSVNPSRCFLEVSF